MCACGQTKCRECQTRAAGRANRKYFWTPALDAMLREAYLARNKHALTAALRLMAARTRMPRFALTQRAYELGITRSSVQTTGRSWTRDEVTYLEESMGRISPASVARRLGRSRISVEVKARRISLSTRVRDGYSVADLAEVMGAPRARVDGWLRRGLVKAINGRIREAQVLAFLRRWTSEYDLRRVDQVWFVSVVFGGQTCLD